MCRYVSTYFAYTVQYNDFLYTYMYVASAKNITEHLL